MLRMCAGYDSHYTCSFNLAVSGWLTGKWCPPQSSPWRGGGYTWKEGPVLLLVFPALQLLSWRLAGRNAAAASSRAATAAWELAISRMLALLAISRMLCSIAVQGASWPTVTGRKKMKRWKKWSHSQPSAWPSGQAGAAREDSCCCCATPLLLIQCWTAAGYHSICVFVCLTHVLSECVQVKGLLLLLSALPVAATQAPHVNCWRTEAT